MDFGDATTLGLVLGAVLLVMLALAVPPVLRVLRMRRAERILGWVYWPLLHALDERARKRNEPAQDG